MTVLTMRSCKRYAVRQAASVRCLDGNHVAGLLIELSQDGGRISGLGSVSFTSGDPVVLEVGEQVLPSVVRWASPGVIGVRFEESLYAAELGALLRHTRPEGTLSPGLVAA